MITADGQRRRRSRCLKRRRKPWPRDRRRNASPHQQRATLAEGGDGCGSGSHGATVSQSSTLPPRTAALLEPRSQVSDKNGVAAGRETAHRPSRKKGPAADLSQPHIARTASRAAPSSGDRPAHIAQYDAHINNLNLYAYRDAAFADDIRTRPMAVSSLGWFQPLGD